VIVVAIWKEAGFFMIFYLAALQSISPIARRSRALEGASRWYFFRRVTVSAADADHAVRAVNAVINAFRTVDHIIVMTRGGPDNATRCCSITSIRSASISGTRPTRRR
jgi:sn-glycerol 3-phosphate transport system permease protein